MWFWARGFPQTLAFLLHISATTEVAMAVPKKTILNRKTANIDVKNKTEFIVID